ncbi:hypothetical protein GHT06_018668 [Daphnia sinensis]|uniref:Uncharacterized protein n=1 Tax=Daphnia sinensis TaxID=1820382 RepID=A0AAD5PQE1_9CRUS|nr:hypothetical protein GHT06_018668 [Daphnia sinensis]
MIALYYPTKKVESELQTSNVTASTSDNILFYIGGYIVNKIQKRSKCVSCLESDFTAKDLTELKSKGYLKFASLPLFKLLKVVEKEIQRKLDVGQMFRPNSFTVVLTSVVANKLP